MFFSQCLRDSVVQKRNYQSLSFTYARGLTKKSGIKSRSFLFLLYRTDRHFYRKEREEREV